LSQYGDAINATPDLDLPDPNTVPVDVPLLVDEAKIGCTMGMLLCLDRKQRLVFTLGSIFGCSDTVGGELLETSPENFRQLLARARRDLGQFMNGQCGLVNPDNPCRCPKKTRGFIERGYVDPSRLAFVAEHAQRMADVAQHTALVVEDAIDRETAAVFRDHPFYEPPDQARWIRRILDRQEIRDALRLQ
jgi:hypothetical protein